MVGYTTPDLILGGTRARTMLVALVDEIANVDPDDRSADMAGFRIPTELVAKFESVRNRWSPLERILASGAAQSLCLFRC